MDRLRDWLTLEEHKAMRHLVALKAVVMLGIGASYYLPAEYGVVASLGANLIWLWRL